MVNYFITVIGDYGMYGSKEKLYAIGGFVPFVITMIGPIISKVFSISGSPSLISSILSIMLFIAVIPLLYAPETMDEEIIRVRRFKKHIKKIKEIFENED
jgi:hypothetical protein